jgi:hypothetical protein
MTCSRGIQGNDETRDQSVGQLFPGYFKELTGDKQAAARFYALARKGSPANVFPTGRGEGSARGGHPRLSGDSTPTCSSATFYTAVASATKGSLIGGKRFSWTRSARSHSATSPTASGT